MGFQKQDIERALNQNRFLFMWATGTGKTYAMASLEEMLKYYDKTKKCIILTSSVGVLNLAQELQNLIVDYDPSRTLVVKSITKLKNRFVFDDDSYDILLCKYDCFKAICDAYDKREHKREKKVKYTKTSLPLDKWYGDKAGLIFFDECHYLGNPSSQRTKCVLMNLKFWEYRYLFSATPLDKKDKAYSILKILDNSLVNGLSHQDWLSTYCQLGVHIGSRFLPYTPNMDTWDTKKWFELQDILFDSYAVRRDKDLLGLPNAIDMPLLKVEMSEKHRKIYETFCSIVADYTKLKNDKEHKGLVKEFYAQFQILMASIENPEILKTSRSLKSMLDIGIDRVKYEQFVSYIKDFKYTKDFSKLEVLDDIIEDECIENENKILVYFYHPKTGEFLKERYPNESFLTSDLSDDERFKVIEKFKKSKNKVLFAAITIADTSFTLNEAKAIVYFERTWSHIVYEQSRGRIHRIGQDKEVRYYNLCYENSFDFLQLKALETKGACVESLIKKNMFTSNEWRTLFGGEITKLDMFLSKI